MDLLVTWKPRESDLQQYADFLSKQVDNSSWSLCQAVFDQYVAGDDLVVAAGGFTVDVFADSQNCKVQFRGMQRFYSRLWCLGTAGVDGFLQCWGWNEAIGRREMCYIYGDFTEMGRILRKIRNEKADCVVVYPAWPRHWGTMWEGLPVKKKFCLSAIARKLGLELCQAGPRVCRDRRAPSRSRWAVWAAVVLWDHVPAARRKGRALRLH